MSTLTIRAALERLVEALNDYDPKWDAFPEDALTAARAALAAASEGEGPPAVTISALLHPAAQAVLDAAVLPCTIREGIAAALRALADQDETLFDGDEELMPAVRAVRTDRILAIAAELEGRHG